VTIPESGDMFIMEKPQVVADEIAALI